MVPPQPDGQGADALCISADVAPSGFVKVTLFDKDDKQLSVGELIPKTVTDAAIESTDSGTTFNLVCESQAK